MSALMLGAGGGCGRPAAVGSCPAVATRWYTPPGVAFGYVDAPNVLREDLPLPLGVLRASALERNLARFQQFSAAAGVLLCPHAKTTMAPALFGRQLAAGSWGLTFANGPQLRAAREHGGARTFSAHGLVGGGGIPS